MTFSVQVTICCVVTCTNLITLFLFPSCDNFLYLMLYIKFLAFLLVKTIYRKSKFPKGLPWKSLQWQISPQNDLKGARWWRPASPLHGLHSPSFCGSPRKAFTGISGSSPHYAHLRKGDSYYTNCLWNPHWFPDSFASPGHSIGLGYLSFCWYSRLARWPLSSSLCLMDSQRQRRALYSCVSPGVAQCLTERGQCTIIELIIKWQNEASTLKEVTKSTKEN